MNAQKGFTLIELMIVIAIIGILAAIALPAYQDYTARAQASEGFKATSGLQTDIGVYYADKGSFPNTAAVADTGVVGKPASEIAGKYFSAGNVKVQADTGAIGIKFDSGSNADTGMKLTPTAANGQISKWTCAPDKAISGATSEIAAKRLPASCQS